MRDLALVVLLAGCGAGAVTATDAGDPPVDAGLEVTIAQPEAGTDAVPAGSPCIVPPSASGAYMVTYTRLTGDCGDGYSGSVYLNANETFASDPTAFCSQFQVTPSRCAGGNLGAACTIGSGADCHLVKAVGCELPDHSYCNGTYAITLAPQ